MLFVAAAPFSFIYKLNNQFKKQCTSFTGICQIYMDAFIVTALTDEKTTTMFVVLL